MQTADATVYVVKKDTRTTLFCSCTKQELEATCPDGVVLNEDGNCANCGRNPRNKP
jgi:hypothetical protein